MQSKCKNKVFFQIMETLCLEQMRLFCSSWNTEIAVLSWGDAVCRATNMNTKFCSSWEAAVCRANVNTKLFVQNGKKLSVEQL